MAISDEIMTLEEVAAYLKLKPQTLYKWAQEGNIPGTKIGKEWRFRKSIIDEWIDSGIHLSPGGFDLMMMKSYAAVRSQDLDRKDVSNLIAKHTAKQG
jgi:excisionase family DNA binding protein